NEKSNDSVCFSTCVRSNITHVTSYMPFITEEIWQQLPHEGASITIATWPTVNNKFHDVDASNQMEQVMAIIKSVRNIRAEVDTPMSRQVNMILKPTSTEAVDQLSVNRLFIERFCNTSELTIDEDATVPEQSMSAVVTGAEIFLPLEGLIDFEKEIARLEKELEKWNKEVALVEKKLSNK